MADQYTNVVMQAAPGWLAERMIGPLIAGHAAQLLFFGMFAQMFIAHCASGEFSALPSRVTKAALVVLFVLNAAYTAFNFDALYKASATQRRTIDELATGPPEWNMLPLLGGLIAAISQTLLTLRAGAFITNRKIRWAFYGSLLLLILGTLVGSLAACTIGFIWVTGGIDWQPQLGWNTSIAIWMWVSAVADLSISIAFAISLRRRMHGFNLQTDSLLKRLIWYSVRTASYTAIVAIGGAVAASIFRDSDVAYTNLSVAFVMPMGALYGLAVFTTTTSSRRAVQSAFTGGPVLPAYRADPTAGLEKRRASGLPAPAPNATAAAASRGMFGLSSGVTHRHSRSADSGIDERSLKSLYLRPRSAAASEGKRHSRHGAGRGRSGELRIQVEQQVERAFDEPDEGGRREGSIEERRSRLSQYITRSSSEDDGGRS
ncbi:hypothetical protein JCM10449v2_000160 [Rhodotorula kratochvilovae]